MIEFNHKNANLAVVADHYFRYLCAFNNYPVLVAPEGLAYDVVIDTGKLHRVQIKSSSMFKRGRGESFRLTRLRTNTKRTRQVKYTDAEIDYFFLYHANGRCWFIPISLLNNRNSVMPAELFRSYEVSKPTSVIDIISEAP